MKARYSTPPFSPDGPPRVGVESDGAEETDNPVGITTEVGHRVLVVQAAAITYTLYVASNHWASWHPTGITPAV